MQTIFQICQTSKPKPKKPTIRPHKGKGTIKVKKASKKPQYKGEDVFDIFADL